MKHFPPTHLFRFMLCAQILCCFCSNDVLATEPLRLRINLTQPANDPSLVLIERWARKIELACNEALKISIYGGGELYDVRTEITAVARAHIEGAAIIIDYWGRTIPVMDVLTKPFAFTGLDSVSAYSNSPLDRYLTNAIEKKGLKVLAWLVYARMAAITTNDKPLAGPADYSGKKIRSVSLLLNSALRAAGASPISLVGGEVYMGLHTGMIDGALTIPTAAYRRRYYEVNDYATITPLFVTYQTLAVNRKWWNALPLDIQQTVVRASAQLEVDAAKLNDEREAEVPQLLREKGMNVHLQSQDEIALLQAVMTPVWTATFLEQTGDEGRKVLGYAEEISRKREGNNK
jgi:TRAP-type C4-dicarboxylate transport system substrate-binding protein